jgi:hypothetical protein
VRIVLVVYPRETYLITLMYGYKHDKCHRALLGHERKREGEGGVKKRSLLERICVCVCVVCVAARARVCLIAFYCVNFVG